MGISVSCHLHSDRVCAEYWAGIARNTESLQSIPLRIQATDASVRERALGQRVLRLHPDYLLQILLSRTPSVTDLRSAI